MLFIKKPLTKAEEITLECMRDNHSLSMTRKRAHSILLSNKGYSIQYITEILDVCRQSVSTWIKAWDSIGLIGLLEQHRSGRPSKLSSYEQDQVIRKVKENPRGIKRIIAAIEEELGISICKDTLRKICKIAGLKWKRIKKTLHKNKDEHAVNETLELITELAKQEKQGNCNLFFFDETGFNLQPSVPYAWQETNQYIKVKSSNSKNINVLGFINHACQFESFVFETNINSDIVVACFDEFSKIINKPTYVFLDNASIHRSEIFLSNLENWKQSGLYVIPLPAYAPELNIIEILWRKIKYEWLSFKATESLDSLRNELFHILKNIGTEYTIKLSDKC